MTFKRGIEGCLILICVLQLSPLSCRSFSISEDTQAIISEKQDNVFAYVSTHDKTLFPCLTKENFTTGLRMTTNKVGLQLLVVKPTVQIPHTSVPSSEDQL